MTGGSGGLESRVHLMALFGKWQYFPAKENGVDSGEFTFGGNTATFRTSLIRVDIFGGVL